jgi:integral membrane protein
MSTRTWVTLFKVVAVAEAVSWAGLLVGMYLKHVAGTTEAGVHLFGPIHGGIFLAYGVLTLVVARLLRWSLPRTLAGLACSVPPFATLLFERWALRRGHLDVPLQGPGHADDGLVTAARHGDG